MFDVTAMGELLVDFACIAADSQGYPTLQGHPGGAPSNFLAAVARFGGTAALIGKVGQDAFGALLLETLRQSGIECRGVVEDAQVFTTLAFVTIDQHGERRFSFARKPGADSMLRREELDLSLIEACRVFHFGSLSLTGEPVRSAAQAAVAYARQQGRWISFDPNLRAPLWQSLEEARAQMLWGIEQADVVKLSGEEADFLFGPIQPEEAAALLLERYGCRLVYVTLGAEGCCYANPRASGRLAALPGLHPVDTTGAGDIFGGAAMWGLLQSGKAPEQLEAPERRRIAAFACGAAGLSTERAGGISSIPSREDVMSRVMQ